MRRIGFRLLKLRRWWNRRILRKPTVTVTISCDTSAVSAAIRETQDRLARFDARGGRRS